MSNIQILAEVRLLLLKKEKLEKIVSFGREIFNISTKDISMFLSGKLLQPIEKLIQDVLYREDGSNEARAGALENYQTFWRPNESKKFLWISVCTEFVISSKRKGDAFSVMGLMEWLFSSKDRLFLEYSSLLLVKEEKLNRQRWQNEELELFKSILRDVGFKGKWAEIAYSLFSSSGSRFFRTPQQCREKWSNCINPNVLHRKWSRSEDELLLILILQHGKKWALISKAMRGSRTEHMVKNRFKSLTRNYESKRYSYVKMLKIILRKLQREKSGRKIKEIPKELENIEEKSGDESDVAVQLRDKRLADGSETIEVIFNIDAS